MHSGFEREPSEKSGISRAASQRQQEDLRSVKSEYDYANKKKFVDVLGNISVNAKLNAMRNEAER